MSIDQAMQIALDYQRAGRLAEAEQIYRQILSQLPNHADALHFLGVLMGQSGRLEDGIDLLSRAIAIHPNIAPYHNNLGNCLRGLGRVDEAIAAYETSVRHQPDQMASLDNLSQMLMEKGEIQKAVAVYRNAARLFPESPEILNALGRTLFNIGEFEQAIASYRQVVRYLPNNALAYNNLGTALTAARQLPESIAVYSTAIELDANIGLFHGNLGNTLGLLGRLNEGIASCRRAIELQPDLAEAHWNLGLMLLLTGDFERGWEEYEWRNRRGSFESRPRQFAFPWAGEDLNGKTILIHIEQGFGDVFQMCRYIPVLARQGARVVLECVAEIFEVMKSLPGVTELIVAGEMPPRFDFSSPLMSLPRFCGTTLTSIPADVPYLFADPRRVENWARWIASDSRLKVGITWAGRPSHPNDLTRSMPSHELARLAETTGITFYSLQKWEPAAGGGSPPGFQLIDLTSRLTDFAETAALIQNLDLIISVDTAVVHLAGAMGKPVWVMLPFVADWRWLMDREDSPWYPTARLFRQSKPGDWSEVVDRIAHALASLLSARHS